MILMMFALFMVAVGGFSLAHYGKLYSGQQNYDHQVMQSDFKKQHNFLFFCLLPSQTGKNKEKAQK